MKNEDENDWWVNERDLYTEEELQQEFNLVNKIILAFAVIVSIGSAVVIIWWK
jgi:hypothetical protein